MPAVLSGNNIVPEDQTLEVCGLNDALPHRSYVWNASIRTIAGGLHVFAGLNAWTADTQSATEHADWLPKPDAMAALNSLVVIPGRQLPD